MHDALFQGLYRLLNTILVCDDDCAGERGDVLIKNPKS